MIQRHSIILWKKADTNNRNFDDIAKEAFATLNVLYDYPIECRPNYVTGFSKKDTKEIDWDFENFKKILVNGVNREGDEIFQGLGSTISVFSSLDEEKSFSFEMTVGNRDERFYNSLVINIPLFFSLNEDRNSNFICEIFRKLVLNFNPFWGCVSNKVIARRYGEYLHNGIPTTIHWLNYWEKEIEAKIGSQRIQYLLEVAPNSNYENRILQLQNKAFDVESDKDLDYHKQVEHILLL